MAAYFFDLAEEFKGRLNDFSRGQVSTPYLTLTHNNTNRFAGDLFHTDAGIMLSRGSNNNHDGFDTGFVYTPNITLSNEKFVDGEIYLRARVLGALTTYQNFSNNSFNFNFRADEVDFLNVSEAVQLAIGAYSSSTITFEWIGGVRNDRLSSTTINDNEIVPIANASYLYLNYRVKLDGNTWFFKSWAGDKQNEPTEWQAQRVDSNQALASEGFASVAIPSERANVILCEVGFGTDGDQAPKDKIVNPPSMANANLHIQGTTTLDNNPISSRVVAVSNDPLNPQVVGKATSAPVDGAYSIPTFYDKEVMVFTMQDYGEDWTPSTALEVGDTVHPLIPNGYFYQVTQAGNTGAIEPQWPVNDGAPLTDGSVTYTTKILLEPKIAGYKKPEPI